MESDWDQLDSILLLSCSSIVDIYYQMLRTAMDNAAAEVKNKAGFDGNIPTEEAENLSEFCNVNQISDLSQALAEVLICMERNNEKKVPEVQETAVYNSLLRLEKSLTKTSNWEIFGYEEEGPLLNLTTLENNLLEQQFSTYIADILSESKSEVLFFPIENFYSSDVIVKWRILEKIATIKLSYQETIYKHKLKFHLKERLKHEVSLWIKKEIEKLKLSNTYTVRKDTENVTKILKDLQSQVTMAFDVTQLETLFKGAKCSYSEILTETIDEVLFPVCERVMELMDAYQVQHGNYLVNMRDSCALSHGFYLQLKKLYNLLAPDKKNEASLKLQDYVRIFTKFFVNLLEVIKSECHLRIRRAVQDELKDSVHNAEKIFSSSVIVLNCVCTVIDEWKHLEIDEEEQGIAFLVKITDVVCDGVKIYAESLECRLQAMNFLLKDMESMKKACVSANSVKHVLQYLQELPQQMQWSANLKDDSGDNLNKQVLRILKLIHESMNTQSAEIIARMLNAIAKGMCNSTEKLLLAWLQSQVSYQSFDKFLAHLNDNLEIAHENLKKELFPQLLSYLWSSLLLEIEKGFQEGQPPEYARTVKENILGLKEYLESINMTELDVHKLLLQKLMELLDLNSKTTEELQLDYYVQIAESIVSPVEYLGHIAFQAGYKTIGNDLVDLYINVQKGQRLPARKCEMSQLTVKVDLCPGTLFPSSGPLKSSPITEDLDNPVFNNFFQFTKLPANVMDVKGAAVQVLVLNQDYSYSAEAILLLNQVQNMSGIASFEFLPVYLMPLRKFDMSHISYQVLENRSRWDKNAKIFINKRGKLSKNQKKFLPCISGKNIMCSFSRND